MNKHLNPIFRAILECAECKVLAAVGHGPRCSQYIQPPAIDWAADGFVRTPRGHIEGFAVTNEQIALVEQEVEERRAWAMDEERRAA